MRDRIVGEVMLGLAALAAAGRMAAAGPAAGSPSRSDICGECHREIHAMWKRSAHAAALEDPAFLEAYRETAAREGASVSRACLGCHAPGAAISKDFDLELKSTWDGVGCDVCHSIRSVTATPAGARMTIEIGKVKRGPIRDAASMAHEVAYSELHGQSIVCAPCHEFVNAQGTAIMTTFSEWRDSSAARNGTQCQDCHMGRTKAYVVDPIVKRLPDAHVNLHEVPGGHSIAQLHKALEINLDPRRDGDSLVLDVRIRNKGAGHAVPTGMPGRRVILEVKVRSSAGRSFEESRVYGKTFADASGAAIRRDAALFARGVRLVSDARLQADERKTETFRFPVPAIATAYVSLKMSYEHAPTEGPENRTYFTFLSEERTVAAAAAPGR